MMGTQCEPGSRLAKMAGEMRTAAERAAGLVRHLLAFVRRDPTRVARTDPGAVLSDLRGLLLRVVGEQIEVELALDDAAGEVMVDREQLEQVVLNLAANARDAMPRGGRLTLSTCAVSLGDAESRAMDCSGPAAYVALVVADTGVGMTAEVRERVFEPLFTTKAHGLGSGLGLATAHRFARQNGGCIAVQSEPGRGTTVRIYLPRADGFAADDERAPDTPLPRGRETVLVVDDDDGVLATVQLTLEDQGYRVLAARSGQEALEMLDEQGHAVELALLDVVMPGVDGRALADALRGAGLCDKVLFMSGHADGRVKDAGIREDAAKNVLRKAFSPAELARSVRRVLDAEHH
jgi:CheY-like chemotaxis protein